jgi:hypothetical protein
VISPTAVKVPALGSVMFFRPNPNEVDDAESVVSNIFVLALDSEIHLRSGCAKRYLGASESTTKEAHAM